MTARPLLVLKVRQDRRASAGAPWVFSNEIVRPALSIAPGSSVDVRGSDGRLLGSGFYNPGSLIAVRLFAEEAGAVPDRAFFERRLRDALSLRERLFARPFYRLVHAEGDGLPGLVTDRFGDALVLQVTVAGMELALPELLGAIKDVVAPKTIILRNDAPVRSLEGLASYVRAELGSLGRVQVEENGARYFADPGSGQKTGWYYDQRDNRAFIAGLAQGARVLDLFSYTGGFGILAAKAGAREVTCVDGSKAALALAEESAEANAVSLRTVNAEALNELERLSARQEKFDIVVADPPPFVKSRKDLEAGARAYRKLAKAAAGVVAPGGFLLLASCSHNISLERFAAECAAGIAKSARHGALIRAAGGGPDHPVHPMLPQTAYLKSLVYALP